MTLAGILAVVALAQSAAPVSAQPADEAPAVFVVVTRDAAIHIEINSVLTPYRFAKKGSRLRLLNASNDWYHIQFGDPRGGVREGWIEQKDAQLLGPAAMDAVDLSVPTAPQPIGFQPVPVAGPTRPQLPDLFGRAHTRRGFWFNVGLGIGSAGCDNCGGERVNGLSGGLSLGGTVGEKWLLGVGTTGWSRETVFGDTLSIGTLDFRARFYPSLEHGFFINGGLGAGAITLGDESEIGAGAMFGLGWDIRVGRNVSVTPFWNGFAMRSSLADANVGQIGVGITIH